MRFFTVASAVLATVLMAQAAPASTGSQLEARKTHHVDASRITYYEGGQLDNPACGGKTPSPHAMIAAVKKGGKFKCHDKIHIQHGKKHVQVHVVDYCAGCGTNAIDLSPGAFKQLASLEEGVVSGAQMWVM